MYSHLLLRLNYDSSIYAEMYDHERQSTVFFYLWISSAVISSFYTLTWDLKMDWGILDKNAGENRFLREEIVYAYKVCHNKITTFLSSMIPKSLK